jgi:transporter family-2 protein
MHLLLAIFGILGGTWLAVQGPLNADLARRLGHPLLGASVSFAVGLASLLILIFASGLRLPPLPDLRAVPLHLWFGGCLGVAYMVTVIVLTPRLGVAMVLSLAVAGQMLTALLIDHVGWFNLDPRPVSATRLLGALLLVAGVVLMTRR